MDISGSEFTLSYPSNIIRKLEIINKKAEKTFRYGGKARFYRTSIFKSYLFFENFIQVYNVF